VAKAKVAARRKDFAAGPSKAKPLQSANVPRPPTNQPFTADEMALLRLASGLNPPKVLGRTPEGRWVYEQRKDALSDDEKLQLLRRVVRSGGRAKHVAEWLWTREILIGLLNDEGAKYEQLSAQFPDAMRTLVARGVFAGLRNEDIPAPFSSEFRQMAKPSTDWMQRARHSKAQQEELGLAMERAYYNATVAIEEDLVPALGRAAMPVGLFPVIRGIGGQQLTMKYVGTQPLTNVVFLARVEQGRGPRPEGEIPIAAVDLFNRAFSSKEEADDARRILVASQTHERMPKYASGFTATLSPGAICELVIGEMERGEMAERNTNTLAVFCDQGRIEQRDIHQFPYLPHIQLVPDPTGGRGGEPLVLGPDGRVEVKGRFSIDDKNEELRKKASAGTRRFVVDLSEGATYTFSLQYRAAKYPPDMRIYGPDGNHASNITWARLGALTSKATFRAHGGKYTVDCHCRTDDLCQFTLTVRRQ
jgi:hypothetical protein